MCLNPTICTFGVQAGKFFGFMLTTRRIEANPNKCKVILHMQSPTNVKEVQWLAGHMAGLSRFLACLADRLAPFFQCLKQPDNFQWTKDYEKAFIKLKLFLSSPPVLKQSNLRESLILYLLVSDKAVSSILVQEERGVQQPIYFASKAL